MEIWKHGDLERRKHGNLRHGNIDAWRHGDIGYGNM
jgi:hypothetical protein